MTIYFPKANSS